MTKKLSAVFAGVISLGMCLILYPFLNDYIVQPAYELAQTLVPGMGDVNDFIWQFLPWGILFFIFFACLMIVLGKAKWTGGSDDEE